MEEKIIQINPVVAGKSVVIYSLTDKGNIWCSYIDERTQKRESFEISGEDLEKEVKEFRKFLKESKVKEADNNGKTKDDKSISELVS